jgi:hypothetical protein
MTGKTFKNKKIKKAFKNNKIWKFKRINKKKKTFQRGYSKK